MVQVTVNQRGVEFSPLYFPFSLPAPSGNRNMQQSVKINLSMSKRYLPRRKLQDNFLLGRKFPILIIIWNKLETFSSVLKNLFFLSAKCQFNLKKTPAPRNVSAPTFPFCCYCSFQTFVSLTGTLAGNTWFQSALPSVPVLNWTVSCTQTQPQRKPSGPTHRLRSKYLSMIFKALRDLGPMHFADFSSWDALVIQCPVTLDTSLAAWYVRYSFAPVTSSGLWPSPSLSGGNQFIHEGAATWNGIRTNPLI